MSFHCWKETAWREKQVHVALVTMYTMGTTKQNHSFVV